MINLHKIVPQVIIQLKRTGQQGTT